MATGRNNARNRMAAHMLKIDKYGSASPDSGVGVRNWSPITGTGGLRKRPIASGPIGKKRTDALALPTRNFLGGDE